GSGMENRGACGQPRAGFQPAVCRSGFKTVAPGFAGDEPGADVLPILGGEVVAQGLDLGEAAVEGADDFGAVLLKNLDPHGGVAGGDAGGVAQAVAREVSPVAGVGGEEAGQRGGQRLGQVADVRDDAVVLGGRGGHDFGAGAAPEGAHRVDGLGGRVGGRGDEADAFFKEVVGGVFPAGVRAAGHGMGADEDGAGGQGGGDLTAKLELDAADVGEERGGREVRGDAGGQLDDALDGGGQHDQIGVAHGELGGVGDGVAPRLVEQGRADLGAARPERDAPGKPAGAGGAGDGGAQQSGGEND